ncbi:phosphoenolpyruvate synthase, partial [candidate division KSB1 bacterium]|nr:phosphoenolpyruvate synthase [candidate division KSB1 bacterium]
MKISIDNKNLSRFNRAFFDASNKFTYIGSGELGGKAAGLLLAKEIIDDNFENQAFDSIRINIPNLTVITTSFFDQFMSQNDLYGTAHSDQSNARIAHAFQQAELPMQLVGDLRALIAGVHSPLAIRSSSMLEDA